MKYYLTFFLLVFLSCTDLLDTELNLDSVNLDGGSWIQVMNRDEFTDAGDLNVLEGSFTLEFFISGGNMNTTDSPALFTVGNDDGGIEIGFFLDQNQPNIIRVIWDEEIDEINLENLGYLNLEDLDLDWNNSDKYYHISFIYDVLNSNLEILLNNQYLIDFNDYYFPDINENDLFIGVKALTDLPNEPENFWKGFLDEFRIWNTPLDKYFYFEDLIKSYSGTPVNNEIDVTLANGTNYSCMVGTEWDSTSTFIQILEDFHDQYRYSYTDGGCYCNENADDSFDCWSITSVLDYHYTHPEQVITTYGDPLLDSLICLLRFNEYPDDGKTVKDESGNQNHGTIYSLPGFKAEFVEDGF